MIDTELRASAELVFARRGRHTILAQSRVEAPLAVVRPFAAGDGRLLVQLVTVGPGLCGGDRVRVSITAEAGTRAVVTTTAATRVMAMDTGAHAAQDVVLHAAEDATLEYYPCVTIPFPASAMVQTTRVEAAPTARVGVVECWALGRTARDEYLQFRSLSGRTTLAIGGGLRYMDVMQLEPAAADLTGAGVLAGRRYVAAGFWYGATLDDRGEPDVESAGTLLAIGQTSPGLVYFRALSSDAPAMDAAVRAARNRATREWGPPIDMRRFHG